MKQVLKFDDYRRKSLFVGVVVITSLMVAASFVLLWAGVREFIAFDADKAVARQHIEQLKSIVANQEQVYAQLTDEIAKSRAIIESQQLLLEDYAITTGKIAIAKQALKVLCDKLTTLEKTVAAQKGTNEALVREVGSLEKLRQTLTVEVGLKQKEIDEALVKLTDLKQQTLAQISAKQIVDNELEVLKDKQEGEQVKLSVATIKTNEAKKTLNSVEKEIENAKKTHADIMHQTMEQSVKLKEDTGEVVKSSQLITRLKKEIVELSQRKTILEAQLAVLETASNDATATMTKLETQLTAKKENIVKLDEENTKMQATKGMLAAQIGAFQEQTTGKKREREHLDDTLKELTELRASQNKQIALLEQTIRALTAERNQLQTDVAVLMAQKQKVISEGVE